MFKGLQRTAARVATPPLLKLSHWWAQRVFSMVYDTCLLPLHNSINELAKSLEDPEHRLYGLYGFQGLELENIEQRVAQYKENMKESGDKTKRALEDVHFKSACQVESCRTSAAIERVEKFELEIERQIEEFKRRRNEKRKGDTSVELSTATETR